MDCGIGMWEDGSSPRHWLFSLEALPCVYKACSVGTKANVYDVIEGSEPGYATAQPSQDAWQGSSLVTSCSPHVHLPRARYQLSGQSTSRVAPAHVCV